jgi:hypothetical protein
LLLLAQGCSSASLSPADLARLRDERGIHVVHHPTRFAFPFMSNEGATGRRPPSIGGPLLLVPIFLAVEAAAMTAAGMSDLQRAQAVGEWMLREYGIDDPVLRVAAHFVELLTRDAEIRNVRQPSTAAPSENFGAMRQAVGGGMAIDFKTITWIVFSHHLDPYRYVVVYRAHARLLRLDEDKVVWEADCDLPWKPGDRPREHINSLPTLEELMADRGAVLKARFEQEADTCAEATSSIPAQAFSLQDER